MFYSKNRKFSKLFRRFAKGSTSRVKAKSLNKVLFSSCGFFYYVFGKNAVVSREQLVFVRSFLRVCFKQSRVFFLIFPHNPRTAKGLGSRIGKGKGGVVGYVTPVKAGSFFFKVSGVTEKQVKYLQKQLSRLLGIPLVLGGRYGFSSRYSSYYF